MDSAGEVETEVEDTPVRPVGVTTEDVEAELDVMTGAGEIDQRQAYSKFLG